MTLACSYCGADLDDQSQGRFYPEDDSILCGECFPVVPGGSLGEPETAADLSKDTPFTDARRSINGNRKRRHGLSE